MNAGSVPAVAAVAASGSPTPASSRNATLHGSSIDSTSLRQPGSATSTRVPDAEVEILRPQHLGAWDRDRADLQGREHHREPLGDLPDEHEHAVPRRNAAVAQEAGPAGGILRNLAERQVADVACDVDEPQR